MPTPLSDEDVEFCCLYGAQCRDFYGDVPWEFGAPRVQQGWLRVRGANKIGWREAEAYIHAGWNYESSVAERARARERSLALHGPSRLALVDAGAVTVAKR